MGQSGRIFDAILRSANLERSDYWVGNVFDEKLPENEFANWCVTGPEAADIEWEYPRMGNSGKLLPKYHHHLYRLRDELLDAKPNVIVPLGGTALWAFTGSAGISAARGAVVPASLTIPGAKLVPTFHPAYVMRQWKLFTVAVGDFNTAAAQAAKGPEIVWPERSLVVEPTRADLADWTPKLLNADLLSVDIETGWGFITCIGFAPNEREAICVPFVDLRTPNRSYWKDPADEVFAWEWCKRVLESGVPKVGQNFAGYDFLWLLERAGIGVRNLRHDTRLLHHALYPELPKDLAFMGASYATQGAWKMLRPSRKEKRDD